MSTVYVQFESDKEITVVSVFGNPQDPVVWANQGEISDEDPRYLAFVAQAATVVITDPIDKLKAFLNANPDVAEILK
jgi:hypothetical protein